ncbi:2-amino-4-hydroxy-6-hydroxymethyldihydropteridine diphosphokinase [Candidatus Woesearchaeota archaeon]|nr:2-amino-4-hydroxy-6-hydroxymethyldihydropteridine diphosphokinase [Candidatus Woesearchaeota archaeon]
MTDVFVGIGSNIGHKEENIRKAVDLIKEKCKILKKSSLYETEPVGYREQDWFLNCAIEIETKLEPLELLEFLQSIEKKMGRIKKIKNGPRIIDMDILFYDNLFINEKNLIIPHPRLHERLFVLEPLKEIAPYFVHPVLNRKIKELYKELTDLK